MAIEVREQKGKLKVYRRAYDPALGRGNAKYVGSFPVGLVEIPAELGALLNAEEIVQLRVKMGVVQKAEIAVETADDGNEIDRTVRSLHRFADTAAELLASDRDRLTVAAKVMVAAFNRLGVIKIGNVDYVESGTGRLTILDGDDDPFAIPSPPRKAEAGEQVYSTADDGRISAKVVTAGAVGGLPVVGELGRAKAAERYPGINVDGLVSEWHDRIRPAAARYSGKTQFDVDSDFIHDVPRIVAARLRAKLPDGSRVADFNDEAERITFEEDTTVTAEQLWRYAKRLEGFAGDRRTPVSDDLLTDLRAFLGLDK